MEKKEMRTLIALAAVMLARKGIPMRRMVSLLLAVVGLGIVAVAPSQSRAANLTTLVGFGLLPSFADGADPWASLIADANGNLLGTTSEGGAYGGGTVFEIAKTDAGYASSVATLVSFNGSDGANPFASLITDANGNLLGTTVYGGTYGSGTVFEIAKTDAGYASSVATLVSFNGSDGANPFAGLITDVNGNLFGTTYGGGKYGRGAVFEIAKTDAGYASSPAVLVSFNGTDGAGPTASLITDSNGNLLGTTSTGGTYGRGTVFEIAKTDAGYDSSPTVLVSFNGTDSGNPTASLITDANGNLFGTTAEAGAFGQGTVFEVFKTTGGYANIATTLVNFNGSDGASPTAGLIADTNGNLFGTTFNGGALYGVGSAFEITASGFVVAPVFAGTPGKANCHGQSISALAKQYGGLNNAAAALGYPSVSALQDAILAHCGG
jgi:uncharacterized repeat protein (TIGR03803 family)